MITPAQVSVASKRYESALRALEERGRFGIRLGLGRTRALLRALGDPEQRMRGVLVAGTNGKGSVQALIAAVLRSAGIRTGQTPKPHLVSYRERILVDGAAITESDFADLIERVLEAAQQVPARLGPATEFEIVTAAAFDWFGRCEVGTAVVEVGLGGRLDATNAWDGGVVAFTTVALDHTEHLGSTLTQIGREKAAIIKRGDLAVSGVTGAGAAPILRRAQRLGVPLDHVTPLRVDAMDRQGLLVRHPDLGALRVGLLGRHQAANAAVAIAAIDALGSAGIARVDERAIREGLAGVRWPGRMELLSISADGRARRPADRPDADHPDLLLDGAHNPDGALALARAIDDMRPMTSGGRPVLVVGAMSDKDGQGILSAMMTSPSLSAALGIATTVPDSARSMPADTLARLWPATSGELLTIPDTDEAMARAIKLARSTGGPIIVAGSLRLVGHVRWSLVDDPDQPMPRGSRQE